MIEGCRRNDTIRKPSVVPNVINDSDKNHQYMLKLLDEMLMGDRVLFHLSSEFHEK